MTDEADALKAKERERAREFPETLEVFKRVREALAARLFKTPLNASEEREMIYTKVAAIDAVAGEMMQLLAKGAGSEQIAAYVERMKKDET